MTVEDAFIYEDEPVRGDAEAVFPFGRNKSGVGASVSASGFTCDHGATKSAGKS